MHDRQERLRDELLVLRCQEGSGEALDELVQRWYPRLLRYARFHVATPETAADLTQETWMAIVKDLHRLADASAFPAWAYRIVTNKCRDWLRRHQLEKGVFAETTAPDFDRIPARPSSPCPEAEALEMALSTLEADDRTMVTLYYFEDLTVSQIAGIFGIPAGTVKSRLHRCRSTLRTYLEESRHD